MRMGALVLAHAPIIIPHGVDPPLSCLCLPLELVHRD